MVQFRKSPSAAPSLFVRAGPILLLLSARVFAQGEQLELTWAAPPACPTASEVKRAVMSSAATHAVETTTRPTLHARAHVSQGKAESGLPVWHVLLKTERGGSRGQREIEAESCAALAEATAVVLSLALLEFTDEAAGDPPEEASPSGETPSTSTLHRPPVGPKNPSDKPPASAERRPSRAEQPPPEEKLVRSTPVPQRRRSLGHFALSARGGFNVGSLPRLAPGAAFGAAWLPGPFRFELGAQMWGAQSASIDDTPAGADLSLKSLGARGCVEALRAKRFALSPCIGSEFHQMTAQGFGSDSNYDAAAYWPALLGGVLGVARVTSRLALRAEVEGRVPLARPRFFVERMGTVHEIPGFSVTSLFGAEVHFP